MKRFNLLFLLTLCIVTGRAQEGDTIQSNRSSFVIGMNLSGDASLISLNFEKLFYIKPAFALAAKMGFGFNQEFQIFSTGEPTVNYFILPMSVTCNFGKGRSYLECGIGGSLVAGNDNSYYLGYPIIGYRYHPFKNPGFSFRVWLFYPFGQLPVVESTDILFAPFGVSFGIAL